jgi:hypothetical protein
MPKQPDTTLRAALARLFPSLDDVPQRWEAIVADAGVTPRDRHRRPRRLASRLTIAAAAAAALAFGVVAALPGGTAGPADASAGERAAAALAAFDGASSDGPILHTVQSVTRTGAGGGDTVRTETWYQTTPPYDWRQVESSPNGTTERAQSSGRAVSYDPRTNTISTLSAPSDGRGASEHGVDPWQRLRDQLVAQLRSGRAREDGRVTLDGRDAIRIVTFQPRVTLLVDAKTYEPIEWRFGATSTRVEVHERLAATSANLAQLRLGAQHPGAKVEREGRGRGEQPSK